MASGGRRDSTGLRVIEVLSPLARPHSGLGRDIAEREQMADDTPRTDPTAAPASSDANEVPPLPHPTLPPATRHASRTARFDLGPLATDMNDRTGPSSTRSASPEPLATPTLAQSYGHLKKNLSFKSLRDLEVRELSEHIYRRGARTDNLKYRPKNDDEIFTHALKGGIRALAFL